MNILNLSRLCPVLLACASWLLPITAQADTQQPAGKHVVEKSYKIRITLTDKKNCGYSVSRPEEFLSVKSLARRKRYGLKVDSHDLPVSRFYVEALQRLGLKLLTQSKWTNTVLMQAADSCVMSKVRQLQFVKEARCVWESPDSIEQPEIVDRASMVIHEKQDTIPSFYGIASKQVEMLHVDSLHQAGWKGQGVTIAVIDGGFYNADLIPGLHHTRILGTRNFVRPGKSVYEELSHGMMVLSCLGANSPHALVGTAPEASFYLLVSEDGESEQMVEEDYWCAAVEYADSLGADMVTSSLGYFKFDHDYMSHHYWELNGHTALNSQVASLAASRGIVLLNSAGNSGNDRWKKIGFPADATDMLAVGAVDSLGTNTNFSSLGNSADGRVKPDVMAMGQSSSVYGVDGQFAYVNGTSFSCPILCGAVACLIQAYPHLQPTTIINAVRMAGNNAMHPDNVYGYGLPNFQKAFDLLKNVKK